MSSHGARYDEKIITAQVRWWLPNLPAIWAARELFVVSLKRQFILRYKQTLLGVLWAVLEPLAQLIVFWFLFGVLLRVQTNDYPYVVYAFAGLIPWGVFSKSTLSVSTSLLENMGVVSKVYFPRIILPCVAVAREGLDALITLSLLLIICAFYGYPPSWRLLLLPILILSMLGSGLVVGLLFTGPMVRFRDLRVPLQYIIQLAMYLTPIVYPPSILPQRYRFIMELNPMYWVIEGTRWIFLGQPIVITPFLYVCLFSMLMLFIVAWVVFAATERSIVDVQ
jgi:lipopolysaccharide transport system permease protein